MKSPRSRLHDRTMHASGAALSRVCFVAAILAIIAARPQHLRALQPSPAAKGSASTWRFAVSGDSRNCGNVVMPAIAVSAQAQGARFFWHLGDFRALSKIDEDFADAPSNPTSQSEYEAAAWGNFIENQLKPFRKMPVFLTLGNHEMIRRSRADYIAKFREWLSTPAILRARRADNPSDASPQTYYHWDERGIDFITLDNATDDQFDAAQMAWFEQLLTRDEKNPAVGTIVVGMHKPLPGSISEGHSMSESGKPLPIESGRQVYRELLRAQNDFHKKVYVLASHSHYFMDGIFNTEYWKGNVLPGWIVGTTGAERYQLHDDWRRAHLAIQGAYGYLLATVSPGDAGGATGGAIQFEFQLINRSDLPQAVRRKFSPKLIDFCFDQNMRPPDPSPPSDPAK